MNLKKAKTIVKAFLDELPVDEKWYQDRIETCNGCEYNTKNITREDLKLTDKLKISTGVCDNNNHCTACGCCIERKCSVKSETCGKVSIGLSPNWLALEVESELDKSISVINATPEIGTLSNGEGEFIYTVSPTASNKISFSLQIKRSNGLNIKSYNAGCSCTVGEIQVIDKETSQLNIDISTLKFKEGEITNKTLYVTYLLDNKVGTKTIKFLFKIFKNGNK
jgi:hypothetical protein